MAKRLMQHAARGLRLAGIGALSLASLGFWSDPAAAERKVALVIGNAAYAGSELVNPVNDATAVSARLKQLGFEVILARDVNQQAMRKSIADFADRLSDDATGLFFFAGHGLQVNGRNYLVPVGSTVSSEARVVLINPTAGPSFATLHCGNAITIGGSGQITLNAPGSGARFTTSASGSLTTGEAQTIRGQGSIFGVLNNHGLVLADLAGGILQLRIESKSNFGTIRASGGTIEITTDIAQGETGVIDAADSLVQYDDATLVGGTIASSGDGRHLVQLTQSRFFNVDSFARVEVQAGSSLRLGAEYTNFGTLDVNYAAAGSACRIWIDGPLTINGTGEIILRRPNTQAQIAEGPGGELTLGPGQTLRGIGQIAVPTTLEGTIAPGLSVGTLTVDDPTTTITWEPTSTLDVELRSASSFDRVSGGSHTINGGAVNVSLVGGYSPALFTKHTIIDGASGSAITGRFDSVMGPALPSPLVWKVGYPGNDVVVGVSCPSDVNADFLVDILDFLDFIDDFATCEQQPAPCGNTVNADFNGDTFVDILDFLDFFDAFGSGC